MQANLLRGEIISKGMTVKTLADAIGMKPKTFYNKLNGTSQFTVDEAIEICAVLKIEDGAKKAFIFLT